MTCWYLFVSIPVELGRELLPRAPVTAQMRTEGEPMRKNHSGIMLGCSIACFLISLSGWSILPEPQIYSITFDTDGGSAVTLQTVQENGKAMRPVDPTKTGYTFDNWYAEDTFDTV